MSKVFEALGTFSYIMTRCKEEDSYIIKFPLGIQIGTTFGEELEKSYEIIKQALIKAQEQEKVLKIIIDKEVNLGMLKTCKTVEQYNAGCKIFGRNELTEEEFNTLKRCCNGK